MATDEDLSRSVGRLIMRFAIFGYTTTNLGDDVQSLAAAAMLPRVDAYVERERLDKVRLPEPHRLVMNSWFAIKRFRGTPSESIEPYYFGQCVGRPELVNDAWLAEWRRRQPIGVRDTYSVAVLRERGIDAYYSGCLTTFMGRFFHRPVKREGIVFVDVPAEMERFIPEDVRARARRITNETGKGETNQKRRFEKIAGVLDIVRSAEMVVTRRLHTALPCVGFGTPVTVYLEGSEKNRRRFSGADRFVPIVFHDGKIPEGETWIAPQEVVVPDDMEPAFARLTEAFGVTVAPRWSSVAELVASLPDLPRQPEGLRRFI
jgi:hypothetical protein